MIPNQRVPSRSLRGLNNHTQYNERQVAPRSLTGIIASPDGPLPHRASPGLHDDPAVPQCCLFPFLALKFCYFCLCRPVALVDAPWVQARVVICSDIVVLRRRRSGLRRHQDREV